MIYSASAEQCFHCVLLCFVKLVTSDPDLKKCVPVSVVCLVNPYLVRFECIMLQLLYKRIILFILQFCYRERPSMGRLSSLFVFYEFEIYCFRLQIFITLGQGTIAYSIVFNWL